MPGHTGVCIAHWSLQSILSGLCLPSLEACTICRCFKQLCKTLNLTSNNKPVPLSERPGSHWRCVLPSLMKGWRRASLAVMRLSGSRCIIFSSRSMRLPTCLASPSCPARWPLKSFLTVGFGTRRFVCAAHQKLDCDFA